MRWLFVSQPRKKLLVTEKHPPCFPPGQGWWEGAGWPGRAKDDWKKAADQRHFQRSLRGRPFSERRGRGGFLKVKWGGRWRGG